MLTMPVMRWMAVNIGIFLLTQSTGLVAKEPVEQSWENLKQLKVEQEIQVVQMNVKSLQGTFVGFSEEAIVASGQTERGHCPPCGCSAGQFIVSRQAEAKYFVGFGHWSRCGYARRWRSGFGSEPFR